MQRLELDPAVNDAAMEEFAIGVGFHGLVDALKRRTRRYDDVTKAALSNIVDEATNVVDGLRAAGHYLDPLSVYSGSTPTWALDK